MADHHLDLGAYLQEEIFFDQFRLVLGRRVDKFSNLASPVAVDSAPDSGLHARA